MVFATHRFRVAALAAIVTLGAAAAHAEPIAVVAAENFYGDVTRQIGGEAVAVTSILANPDDDPHLFEASPSVAKALAGARLVIANGADYDPWMEKLLAANAAPDRKTIMVSDLVHRKSGDNPHLWYDPATMPAAAAAIAAQLSVLDPAHKPDFDSRLAAFQESLRPFAGKVKALRGKFAGTPVTATEPVAGYLADALGLAMRNREFQLAVENDAEPSPKQVAAFENDLKTGKVKLLFYNAQATEDLTKRLQALARESHVPIVGVTETEPPGQTFQQWMGGTLQAIERALGGGGA